MTPDHLDGADDAAVLRAAALGDERALAELYDRHAGLTVGHGHPVPDLRAAAEAVRAHLPIGTQATAVSLMTQDAAGGCWTRTATSPWPDGARWPDFRRERRRRYWNVRSKTSRAARRALARS